jgi:hypothetical protein
MRRILSVFHRRHASAVLAVAVMLLCAGARSAAACSVCFGAPDSPQIKAMQAGILVLLGCIGTVLAGFAGLFCYWLYRTQRLSAASGEIAN